MLPLLLMVFFSCLCCNNSPQSTPQDLQSLPAPVATVVSAQAQSIRISGVSGGLALLVDGVPLFDPVPVLPDRTPALTADLVFQFLAQHYVPWTIPRNTSAGASFFGYGFGLCHMQSRILSSLWSEHGINARLIAWPQHTMVEAFFDERWHVFDAQHKVNFSRLWGKPICFEDLAKGHAYPSPGLDPIGYGHAVMQRWYQDARPKRKSQKQVLKRPLSHLSPDQVLLISPRLSQSPFSLPVVPAPGNRLRDALIPGYLLVLSQISKGAPIRLDSDLPILGVSGDVLQMGSALVNGKSVALNALKGVIEPVSFSLPAGKLLRVHYALAAWVGDRLLKPGAQLAFNQPQLGAEISAVIQPDQAHVSLSDLRSSGPSPEGAWSCSYSINWQNLNDLDPLDFTLFATEISSELPVEAWRYLETQSWTWLPQSHGPNGSQSLSFVYLPQARPLATLRRPARFRTLLIYIKGPAVLAGHNFLKTTLLLEPG